jgi:dihydroneopterin aldolase
MMPELTPELIEEATAFMEPVQRLTVEQLAKQVAELCKRNGYQMTPVAIGKKSGQPAPAIDVVADTHYLDIAFVELPKQ